MAWYDNSSRIRFKCWTISTRSIFCFPPAIWRHADCIEIEKDKNAVFLPCRKLKYRGIIFVAVYFHSRDSREINRGRIAEAFGLAQKYNCTKLSGPENFLYDLYYKRNGYSDIIFQLQTLRQLEKKLGKYYETHPNLHNEGYQEFLLRCARKCHGTKKN